MNRRFSFFLIIEAIILFFLLAALFRRGFILLLALAIFLSWLNSRLNSALLKIITGVIWLIALFQILSSGAFWLAVIFPLVIAYYYFRRRESGETSQSWQRGRQNSGQTRSYLSDEDENEIINLADLHYRTGGNLLSVKKANGNVKILVPEEVGIALNIRVRKGLVKIFNEQTEINDVSLHYFSKDYQTLEKRISISISVDNGNVEVLHQ